MNTNDNQSIEELQKELELYEDALATIARNGGFNLYAKDLDGRFIISTDELVDKNTAGTKTGRTDIELLEDEKEIIQAAGVPVTVKFPCWLKLVRKNNSIQSSYSTDGIIWQNFTMDTPDFFEEELLVGLTFFSQQNPASGFCDFEEIVFNSQTVNPEEFETAIIGSAAGSMETKGKAIRLNAEKAQLRREGDSIPFLCLKAEGEFAFSCKLSAPESTQLDYRAGIMIRRSHEPYSQFLVLNIDNTGNISNSIREINNQRRMTQATLRHQQDMDIMEGEVSFNEDLQTVTINKELMYDENGNKTGLAILINNFYTRELANNNLHEAIIRMDGSGLIKAVNSKAEQIFNLNHSELHRKNLDKVYRVTDIYRRRLAPLIEKAGAETGVIKRKEDAIFINNKGQEFILEETWCSFPNPQTNEVNQIVLILNDVTENRKLMRQITYQAQHDTLTGLFNRLAFESKLDELIRNARQEKAVHSFIFLDLDKFKPINDTAGHLAGDMMLKQVADIIKGGLRNSDYAARMGGDEFGALLPYCEQKYGNIVAQRILQKINNHRMVWEESSYSIEASIGLVSFSNDVTNKEDLIKMADSASYDAKRSGGNCIEICKPGEASSRKKQTCDIAEETILNCMEKDSFRLAAQKIVQINNADNIIYNEVFLRSPEATELPPSKVFPVMIRARKTVEIDAYILKKTINTIQNGKLAPVAGINLHSGIISWDHFIPFLLDLAQEHAAFLSSLYFEIDVQTLINYFQKLQELSRIIKPWGAEFIIDNISGSLHGTEYCKKLQVFAVKLDPALIAGVTGKSSSGIIIRHLAAAYKELGIHLIAKQVEDKASIKHLRELGIEWVQGYAVGKPRIIN